MAEKPQNWDTDPQQLADLASENFYPGRQTQKRLRHSTSWLPMPTNKQLTLCDKNPQTLLTSRPGKQTCKQARDLTYQIHSAKMLKINEHHAL